MVAKTHSAGVHSPPDALATPPQERRARYLVAYYSWTGRTARVAKAVAEDLGADVEEIRDARPRTGPFAYMRSAIEASRRKAAPIRPPVHRPEDYDAVVLGCPVWAGAMASPMRAYIDVHRNRLPSVALFCTLGGSGAETTLARMSELCDRAPAAKLSVDAAALESDGWRGAVQDFARHIRARVDPKPEPAA